MKPTASQHGYSLIELVIYIALFALLSIVLVQSLVSVMRTYAEGARYRALQNNGELIMERITRELRNGSTVTTSSCPTTSNTVSISSTDASNTSHTNAFSVSGSAVQLASDGGAATPLSTDNVTVSTLTFCSYSIGTESMVNVHLVLTTTGTIATPASFYSTILLRGK